MRLASATLPLSALLTAACSNAPSKEDVSAAQTQMQNCITIPQLTDVTAKLDGLAGDKITRQAAPDFTIRGMLPSYEEKEVDGKEKLTAKMDVGITFRSAGGKTSAVLSGSKMTTNEEGEIRNYPLFSQDIDAASTDFKGVNVAEVLQKGQACALAAQEKLGLKM